MREKEIISSSTDLSGERSSADWAGGSSTSMGSVVELRRAKVTRKRSA